jgi:hypothetical protein
MSFDFYAIKIQAESRASDDYFLGYFFGKINANLEYRFICFPRKYADRNKADLDRPFQEYKEFVHQVYQNLSAKSSEVVEMTKEFNTYLGLQIRKLGGIGTQSLRFTRMVEENNTDLVQSELIDILRNWTSDVIVRVSLELSSFSQISQKATTQYRTQTVLASVDKERKDLASISDFYPLLDPISGVPIDQFGIGSTILFTITKFVNDDQKKHVIDAYEGYFDDNYANIVPFEGVIVLKELAEGGKSLLIKVHFGDDFFAKSIVSKNMKIMLPPRKSYNRYSQEEEKTAQKSAPRIENKISIASSTASERISVKKPVFDIVTLLIILAIFGILVFIYFFFFLT